MGRVLLQLRTIEILGTLLESVLFNRSVAKGYTGRTEYRRYAFSRINETVTLTPHVHKGVDLSNEQIFGSLA